MTLNSAAMADDLDFLGCFDSTRGIVIRKSFFVKPYPAGAWRYDARRMEFYYDQIENDVLILAADGGLNAQTADVFVRDIEKLVDAGLKKIIVDCSKLSYISSYGLAVLLRLHKRLGGRGGDVKICSVGGIVPQILEVTRLAQWFEVYPDMSQAKLSFRPKKQPTE